MYLYIGSIKTTILNVILHIACHGTLRCLHTLRVYTGPMAVEIHSMMASMMACKYMHVGDQGQMNGFKRSIVPPEALNPIFLI